MTSRNLTRVIASGALLLAACSDNVNDPKPNNPGPAPVAVVQVSPATTALKVGETKQFDAVARDSAGNVLANRSLAWTSSDTTVVKVSAAGLVTAVAAGRADVTARSENREGRAEVTVVAALAPVSSVRIMAAVPDTIEAWDQAQLTALTLDSAGTPLSGREITWSSSDPAVASITPAGVLTGLDRGTVTITATSEGKSDTMTRVVVIRYRSLVTGSVHACNLASGGIAWCWGLNGRDGRIGGENMSDNAFSTEPVRVPGDHRFAQLATYARTTCGLTAQGEVWCWGSNAWGALGTGGTTPAQSRTPVKVTGGHTFRSIAAGSGHMCGITTAGRVYCWGHNGSGELGDGTRTFRPQPVAAPASVTAESLALGAEYSCALTAGGQAWCWGYDGLGNLGDGRPASNGNTYMLTPVQVTGGHTFRQLAAGQYTTCGITTASQAFCWGRNGNRFGSGNTSNSSAPVAVAGGLAFRQLSVGFAHACAVTTDYSVYCWGSNDNGQLGAAGLVNGSGVPVHAGGSLRAAEVAAANVATGHGNISCAISQDRLTTLCWGRNDQGQLGNGGTTAGTAVNYQPSIVVGQKPL